MADRSSHAYCDMNKSNGSVDKLGRCPPTPKIPPPYAIPKRRGEPPEPPGYLPMHGAPSDEYLCPSEARGGGQRTPEGVGGPGWRVGLDDEGYDAPKVANDYSEIGEAFYNNLYEALDDNVDA